MNPLYLEAIRQSEGYTPSATWDYGQDSVGYGTRARYPGEQITKEEAERRFQAEVAQAKAIVDRFAPNLDEGTKAALTSLTYNAGDKWIRSGLGQAIREGDMGRAKELFQQYTKAGGKELPGLVSRRQREVACLAVEGSRAPPHRQTLPAQSASQRAILALMALLARVAITCLSSSAPRLYNSRTTPEPPSVWLRTT